MGLTAFVVFVVPWVVLAMFLTRAPTVLRLGATPAPWRPIPTRREKAREHRRDTNPHNTQTADGSGSVGEHKHEPLAMRDEGTLGPSVEPTEPTDKVG